MFSRFTPLALSRGSGRRRAVPEGRRTHPSHRPFNRSRTRARFQLEGLENRCLLSGISAVTQYSIPSGNGPWYMTNGPDGNIWFTEAPGVGTISPTTHVVSEFAVPTVNSDPREITVGPDGNIWFTEWASGKLARISPTTHAITEFAVSPKGSNYQPWGITSGPDGNLWFTERSHDAIGVFNPSTHAYSSFPLPTLNGNPQGITVGPDGNIWFTEYASNKIGEINPTTHAISEFPLPTESLDSSGPTEITAGPDGNIWFSSYGSSGVGMINPTTQAISLLVTPANTIGGTIATGPDGNLWAGLGQLCTIDTMTNSITQFPLGAVRGITAGSDGNLWFSNGTNISVATLTPTVTDLVVTQQSPASLTAGAPFSLTVDAEDGSGNLLSSFNSTVTLALANNPGNGTLGGTVTATATNGVATFFGLTITSAASGYTLVATSGLSGEGFTSAITVTPAAASQLVITTEPPASVAVNADFGLQASIEDQYGNLVTTATNTVSVAFATNTTGATLGGTLSMSASQGLATFSNLTINKTGNGYTLKVSSSGFSSVVSSSISVTKKGGAAIASSTPVASPSVLLLGALVPDSDRPGPKKNTSSI